MVRRPRPDPAQPVADTADDSDHEVDKSRQFLPCFNRATMVPDRRSSFRHSHHSHNQNSHNQHSHNRRSHDRHSHNHSHHNSSGDDSAFREPARSPAAPASSSSRALPRLPQMSLQAPQSRPPTRPPTMHRRSSEQAAGQRVAPRNYPHHHHNSGEAIPVIDLTSSPALRPLCKLSQSPMGEHQLRSPSDFCGDSAAAAAKAEADAEVETPRKRFECPLCLREERVEGRPQVTIITDCCGNPPPSIIHTFFA